MTVSWKRIVIKGLNIVMVLSCLAGAATVQAADRMVLAEEFTNRY